MAFDTETTRLDTSRPWLVPAYVLGAAFDGHGGVFIQRGHLAEFLRKHDGLRFVFHNAPFDLAVLHLLSPQHDVYRWVDRHLVWDTQLLHRLLSLAVHGHTASGRGQSTLEHCARCYLKVDLPKDQADSEGDPVRLSYGKWLNRPPEEIESCYLEYLAQDVIATYRLYTKLRALLRDVLPKSSSAFGYVSDDWLFSQVQRWGWQTHHIQLKAAIVLRSITAEGLHVDQERQEALQGELRSLADEKRLLLRREGYVPGQKGSGKALQEILRRLAHRHPGVPFERTPTNKFAVSEEALEPLVRVEPFVTTLVEYQAIEKLLNTYLGKMAKRVLHPSFDVLKNTGRTSSFGDLNAQNLPRDDRVRGCFVPPEDHVFLDADYATIELTTLAQAVQSQFQHSSGMAAAINAGMDLHRLVAAKVAGKPESEVTQEERQKAKPINFGKPGGMGLSGLRRYARASYGVELSDDEVHELTETWFDLFPEMRAFLHDFEPDVGSLVAAAFELTPQSHFAHTEDPRFLQHPNNAGREDRPHSLLGAMFLKVLREPGPRTRDGRPYSEADIDYFWTRLANHQERLPAKYHAAIRERQPSPPLQMAVKNLVDRVSVFTLTGRLRAETNYCARHNTVFQGLAADGAKLALWNLWRAGYRICNFIHDEVLIALPRRANLALHAEIVRSLMCKGMQDVVPDVQVGVEYTLADRWSKDAALQFDTLGRFCTPGSVEARFPKSAPRSTPTKKHAKKFFCQPDQTLPPPAQPAQPAQRSHGP